MSWLTWALVCIWLVAGSTAQPLKFRSKSRRASELDLGAHQRLANLGSSRIWNQRERLTSRYIQPRGEISPTQPALLLLALSAQVRLG